jgi:predicted RNA-binding protein YlxR (DUF448 family)
MPKRRPDHVALRTCAVCRQVHPKREMTRLVRGADGSVSFDPTGKAAGRGTYVCNETACREPRRLAEAVRRALGAALEPSQLAIKESHATT